MRPSESKPFLAILAGLVVSTLLAPPLFAAPIDWGKVSRLQDKDFLAYVESLGLKGQRSLDFWKKIPLSRANKQVHSLFRKEAFAIYMKKYPRSDSPGTAFTPGMGTAVTGPISGQSLKLPFTAYQPLPEGPVGDPARTYRIGYTIHGLGHPWLLNNADSAQWEAQRHPNVELTVVDPQFDNQKQVEQIDGWVRDKFDGILVWPMQEAPTGPPVERAHAAGIPTVTVDRLAGSHKVRAQVTGNFPANGAQQGIYLIHRLLRELGEVRGNILMIRKPLGSTADAMRTGHFLKVISYFPGLKILESTHNNSNRADSERQVSEALAKFPDVDVIFCTGAEQAMGAVAAVEKARRWNSRADRRRIIILSNDDLYEALQAMQVDKIAMTAPYTPLLGGLALRVLLKSLAGEKLPRNITTPDLPMITREKMSIFGIETMSVAEWLPYSYGRN
jgi:ribose transport system substrate-binding protein